MVGKNENRKPMSLRELVGVLGKLESSLAGQLCHLKNLFKVFGAAAIALVLIMSGVAWLKADEQSAFAQDKLASATTNMASDLLGDLLRSVDESVAAQVHEQEVAREAEAAQAREAADLAAAAGWRIVDGARRYYLPDGSMALGNIAVDGVMMSFDEQGNWMSSRLDVPYLSQLPDMPFGCELVSVTMMLNYSGVAVSKEELAVGLPYAGDPNVGFTGSLYGEDESGGGIIWPPALLGLVGSYQPSVVDLTGESWEAVRERIDQGKPVCIWFSEVGLDHTVLLTGYSDTIVWVNDPLADKDVILGIDDFLTRWSQNGYRALSY
jgi:uncharacterized protein YvpB